MYYEQLAAGLAMQIQQNESAYQQQAQKQQEFLDRQQWLDNTIIGLITQISTCKERMNGFGRSEDSFQEEFQETFVRNIVGEYEPGFWRSKAGSIKRSWRSTQEAVLRTKSSSTRQTNGKSPCCAISSEPAAGTNPSGVYAGGAGTRAY